MELANDSARLRLVWATNCSKSFSAEFQKELKPLWPKDPAQSPNLFCRLEARLADGHRKAEQTTNLHHH